MRYPQPWVPLLQTLLSQSGTEESPKGLRFPQSIRGATFYGTAGQQGLREGTEPGPRESLAVEVV